MLRVVELAEADRHLALAGSFACGEGVLAKGYFEGLVRLFAYPSLAPIGEALEVFEESARGLQVVSAGALLCLGSQVAISHERPADWHEALVTLALPSGEEQSALALPPGNWRLMKGLSGRRAVVHDTSEDQGVIAVEGEHVLWRREVRSLRSLRPTARGTLVGLTSGSPQALVELDLATGASLPVPALPDGDWSCVLAHEPGVWLLGGATRAGDAGVIAALSSAGALEIVCRAPVEQLFSSERIARARDDAPECGYDLASVAGMVSLDAATVAVAIGGDGEALGACHSACAAGVLSLTTAALSTQVVDEDDGASGLVPTADGALLLDCGGTLRVLRR